jgi:hypothetical protein
MEVSVGRVDGALAPAGGPSMGPWGLYADGGVIGAADEHGLVSIHRRSQSGDHDIV